MSTHRGCHGDSWVSIDALSLSLSPSLSLSLSPSLSSPSDPVLWQQKPSAAHLPFVLPSPLNSDDREKFSPLGKVFIWEYKKLVSILRCQGE